jgi:hypothetical protein
MAPFVLVAIGAGVRAEPVGSADDGKGRQKCEGQTVRVYEYRYTRHKVAEVGAPVTDPTAAACGALMEGMHRVHHHAENGRDVTR